MEKTLYNFDVFISASFDSKGVENVKLRTIGQEKLCLTDVLAAGVKMIQWG